MQSDEVRIFKQDALKKLSAQYENKKLTVWVQLTSLSTEFLHTCTKVCI